MVDCRCGSTLQYVADDDEFRCAEGHWVRLFKSFTPALQCPSCGADALECEYYDSEGNQWVFCKACLTSHPIIHGDQFV